MSSQLFSELERAIRSRNPVAADGLQPGLPDLGIREALDRERVGGDHDALVEIFSWKNGSKLSDKPLSETSLFPRSVFQFLSLEAGMEHFRGFKVVADVTRETGPLYALLSAIAIRYFPLFWDSGHGYLVVDLQPGSSRGVMLVEFESDDPLRQAYSSMGAFLRDAIRANLQNEPLMCFPTAQHGKG